MGNTITVKRASVSWFLRTDEEKLLFSSLHSDKGKKCNHPFSRFSFDRVPATLQWTFFIFSALLLLCSTTLFLGDLLKIRAARVLLGYAFHVLTDLVCPEETLSIDLLTLDKFAPIVSYWLDALS